MSAAEDFEATRKLKRKSSIKKPVNKTHTIFANCPNMDRRYTWCLVTDASVYTMDVTCPRCGTAFTAKR